MAAHITTVYDLRIKTGGEFKKYVTNNLSGTTFSSDTPFKIKRGHQLIAIDLNDVRHAKDSEIQSKLKGKFFGHVFLLRVAIPEGPLFAQTKGATKDVSNVFFYIGN